MFSGSHLSVTLCSVIIMIIVIVIIITTNFIIALMIHTRFLKFIFNQYMFRMKHHPSSVDK